MSERLCNIAEHIKLLTYDETKILAEGLLSFASLNEDFDLDPDHWMSIMQKWATGMLDNE